MPKFRLAPAGRCRPRFLRIISGGLFIVLAVTFWPACWLLVSLKHAEQFGTGLSSFSLEPIGTFALHQALIAIGPWGSLIFAAIAEELRGSR